MHRTAQQDLSGFDVKGPCNLLYEQIIYTHNISALLAYLDCNYELKLLC